MPIDPSIPGQALAGLQRVQPFNPLATLGDLAQLQNYRALQQEREARAQKIQQDEAEDADIQGLAQQYPDDHDAFIQAVYQRGYAGKAAAYEKLLNDGRRSAAEAHLSQLKVEDAHLDAGLRTLSAVTDEPSYQIVRKGIVASDQAFDAILPPTFDPEKLRPVFNKALETKDWLKAESDAAHYAIDGKTQDGVALLFSRAGDQQKWDRATQLAKQAGAGGLAAQYGPQWSAEAQQAAGAQLEKAAKAEKGPNVGSFEDYVTRKYGPNPTPEQILAARKVYGQADDKARVSVTVAAPPPNATLADLAKGSGMTVGALRNAAEQLHNGQQPTGFGMGGKAIMVAIRNAEAMLYGEDNLSASAAGYKADTKSLGNIQTTLDTIQGFHRAALSNLTLYKGLAAELKDTNSPFFNTPIRSLDAKVFGSKQVAAAQAAKAVALREVARITGNPRLTGELSDTSRREVDALIPDGATLNQINEVVKVLETDLSNVERGQREQLDTIYGRLGRSGGQGAAAPAAKPEKKRYKFDAQGNLTSQ